MHVFICFKNNQKKILVKPSNFFNYLTQILDQHVYFVFTTIYLS